MEELFYIAKICNYVLVLLLVLTLLIYSIRVVYFFYGFRKIEKANIDSCKQETHFCVLIPARYEAKVIPNILTAIKEQEYDQSKIDVYVIVEDENDESVNIVQSMGYHYFVRPELDGKRTKGWALDQCISHIFEKGDEYDCFVIFDADNIPEKYFFANMNEARIHRKLKMGFGNRLSSNYQKNIISMCSSIMFQMINIFGNKGKSRFVNKVILTGTGYFIDYDVLKQAGSFIWHGLCEDNELCIWTYVQGLKCGYVDGAWFYDEQPTKYVQNLKQHIRWTWGNIISDLKMRPLVWKATIKKENKDTLARLDYLISNLPLVILGTASMINCVFQIVVGVLFTINHPETGFNLYFIWAIGIFGFFYLIFTIIAISVLVTDKIHFTKASKGLKVASILLFFFYMFDFILAFFLGIFKKNRTWTTIVHSGEE